MIRNLRVFVALLMLVFGCCMQLSANLADTINPVIRGDFADPSVIRIGNKYYAAGTSSEWAPHFPVYVSERSFELEAGGTYISGETAMDAFFILGTRVILS